METPAPRRARRLGAFAAAVVMGAGLVGVLASSAIAQESNDTGNDTQTTQERHRLTDEQRACLQQQGVEKPQRDENGERVPLTDEQKQALRQAADACGIELPLRHRLTDEQRTCLQEHGVERPQRDANGERVPLTDEQKQAFREAADACGINLPDRPPADSNADSGDNA